MDSTRVSDSMAIMMSSGWIPVSRAISSSLGSLPSSPCSRALAVLTFIARSFSVLDTFTGPSSRRKRLISPVIMGTA